MRLSNQKTRNELGFNYVINNINVITPYGKKRLKSISPFEPGEEDSLLSELSLLEKTLDLVNKESNKIDLLLEIFMEIKDNSYTIKRSEDSVLTVVELYEIKTLLLQMKAIKDLLDQISEQIPEEFVLHDLTDLLDVLDPARQRINTFYLYDEFSERLKLLRQHKREKELAIKKIKRDLKRKVESTYNISMTPKFEYVVSKSEKELMEKASSIAELTLAEEDYTSATFTLKNDAQVFELQKDIEELNLQIEEEELSVRESLSKKIGEKRELLDINCTIIGELDFNIAKALYAKEHNCTKPEITKEHVIIIQDGRQLELEDILDKKGKEYCPVSIELYDGVACITGANMGGKTVTLKMVGLCAMLAQYGFFVPCRSAKIGLSSYMHILIGDTQNIQRGLSSFGSEMEELKEILDRSKTRSLLLIDEIASGTNPVEGFALTKSLVKYLSTKPYISLITTHYDNVAELDNVRNMQVRGLADADFDRLAREIRYANRLERIDIISKYMDYRVYEVKKEKKIPKDALNIAKMLGIYQEIIEQAKKYMEDREYEE
ncbi:MAG: DNA mismatch repair protein MutS [Clostridiales bacterium]|nr:DNA mismatch repair protein MutS [Clostridiales bacterium]